MLNLTIGFEMTHRLTHRLTHRPSSARCVLENSFRQSLALPVLASAVLAGSALAQSAPPDAGALRQQIEGQRLPTLPKRVTPAKPAEPSPLKASSETQVVVKGFIFAGNTLLTVEQLKPVLAHLIGKSLSLAELQAAAASIAQTYRDAGWLVRAYLPQQDVSEGMITIQIVEAVFGDTLLEGAEPLRLKLSYALSFFTARQQPGEALNAEALDRALLLADDLPGIAVAGALQEGKEPGQTDLVLKIVDEPLLVGEASIDNTGSRATGEPRLSLTTSLNSPLGLGDLLNAQVILTEGSEYFRLAASLPAGSDGWRVGVNASSLNYDIITPEFKALNPQGKSNSLGLDAIYPIIRSRQRNLYFLANLDQKSYQNESNNTMQSDYRVSNFSLGLSGNQFDSFGGGGANSASVVLTTGRVDLGSLEAGENTALAGSFSKWRAALTRQQVLTNQLSLFGSLTAQYANQTLDSSEKFFLGGSYGVRAYPASEGAGSSGQLATLELRARIINGFNLAAFYDWGSVQNKDGTPSYDLQGAGLSLSWVPLWGGSLRTTYARRIGDNPNPTANGSDQDGSLDLNRWWLTASLPF